MNQAPIYVAFTCLAGLTQYLALLLNIETKSLLWKWGIYVGLIGSVYSAGAFALPRVELFPCLVFTGTIALMLSGVVGSYYFAEVPENYTTLQREARNEVRHGALRQFGIGLVASLALAACVGYTQGQTADSRVQVGFAGVVYRLADEVKALHTVVTLLAIEVRQLKSADEKRTKTDSIRRNRIEKLIINHR